MFHLLFLSSLKLLAILLFLIYNNCYFIWSNAKKRKGHTYSKGEEKSKSESVVNSVH